jgi:hypothetical protein
MPEQHACAPGMMPLQSGDRPFPAAQPYAEQGSVFFHPNPCVWHAEGVNVPRTFFKREAYLIRGYSAYDRIAYGTGRIVAPTFQAETAHHTFRDPRVRYIHVRSVSNDCFQCRIDPA